MKSAFISHLSMHLINVALDGQEMAKSKDKKKDFAKFLACSSLLESETFSFYNSLAEKVDHPLVKSLLRYIAYDSQKHSAILKGIADTLTESEIKVKDCKKELGETWSTIRAFSDEIAEKTRIPIEDLPSLLEKVTFLESTAGEEYSMLVRVKTIQFMKKQIRELYGVDLESLTNVFDVIIRDEEIHGNLLETIGKIIAGKEKPEEEITPIVKYQNPDAWNRPMHPQI